ncbi:MAG: proliferating cell nuclear antigen (pcna) [Candidatus Heimdallarchaeaceae archaeon]
MVFDATRISMIDFFMKKEAFQKYELKETTIVGLSLETLNTILKTAKANESLKMTLDDATKRFVVEFQGKNQTRKFALSLIDIPDEGNIPDSIHIDFDTNFEVKATFIQQVLKDAEMVSDYLKIRAREDGIFFGAESDTKEMDTFIEPKSEEMETAAFQVTGESEAMYSLDFLSNFLKGIRSSDYVKISFNQEQPIRLIYEIEDKGHLIYFVAPRIEESEEID